MKKRLLSLWIVLLVGMLLVPAAFAADGRIPEGGCPVGYHMHDFHDPDGHEHGHHVGLEIDVNGNGMFCAKHLTSGKHVHMDDVLPVE